MHNTLKVYASVVRRLGQADDTEALELLAQMGETAQQRLPLFVQSGKCRPQPSGPCLCCRRPRGAGACGNGAGDH